MRTFDFEKVIRTYEKKRKAIKSYIVSNKSSTEKEMIHRDVDRSFEDFKELDEHQRESLKRILYEVLESIFIEYLQGMNEVASIVIYYYFEDQIQMLEPEDSLTIDASLLSQARITLTNVLVDKYEPLISNEFKLYKHYNKVFMKMMENRNIKVEEDMSLVHMNSTLAWFIRDAASIDDLFTIVAYILACPINFSFIILIKFYREILDSKIKITEEDLYQQLLVLEREFQKTETELDAPEPLVKLTKRQYLIVGAVSAAVLGGIIGAYFYRK